MKGFSITDFTAARERISPIIRPTRLIHSPVFSQEMGNDIYLKPENLQLTGSFKVRGACNKIIGLTTDQKERGLIAASAGNHAQGVALAASSLGVPAVIVMPEITPLLKIEATRRLGAEVILHGEYFDEAKKEALRLAEEEGYQFIHPFDDPDVILGQGTIALEILEDLSDCEQILVPIGGGGLASGVALAARALQPEIRIIGVEPEHAACMKAAFSAGKPVELNRVPTIAEGTAVFKAGDLTYRLCREALDDIITVSDYELMDAFLLLLERHKMIAENAGLLSLGALKKLPREGRKTVCIVSGGNIDVLTISSLIKKGLVSRGRIFRFSLILTDRPGELEKVASHLARLKANIVQLEHNQFKNLRRFSQVELDVTVETNGKPHIEEILELFRSKGYSIRVHE